MKSPVLTTLVLLLLTACGDADDTVKAGTNCTVEQNDDGTYTMHCPDGTSATWGDGDPGPQGEAGTDGKPGSNPYPDVVLHGPYAIKNEIDVALLSEIHTVTGDLTVEESYLTSLSLPQLTTVGGTFEIARNDDLTAISLDSLALVEGNLNIERNPELAELSIDALTTVGSNFKLYSNWNIDAYELDSLTEIVGSLSVSTHGELTTFSMTALTTVGGDATIEDNYAMTSFSLPQLETVEGWLKIEAIPYLPEFSMDSLTEVSRFTVQANDTLTSFSVAALDIVADNFAVFSNPSLCDTDPWDIYYALSNSPTHYIMDNCN